MNKWTRFTGILGCILLIFGLIGWLVFGFNFGTSRSLVFLNTLIGLHLAGGLLLVIFWTLFCGIKNLSSAGGLVKGRTVRFSFNVILYAIVFIGVLGILNWIVFKNNKRWDLTEQGVYSIAPQSVNVIKNLKKRLKIVAVKGNDFIDENSLKQLLERYRDVNKDLVSIEVLDPRSKPHLVEAYQMKQGNLIYLEYGNDAKDNLEHENEPHSNKAVSRINEATEEAITNAILKLTKGEAKKVYIVEGHGELSIEDGSERGIKYLAEAIQDEHMTVKTLFLAQMATIPTDAGMVILAAPQKLLLENEKDMLIKYVEQGGRLLLLTDSETKSPAKRQDERSDIVEIAAHFGITVEKAMTLDVVQRLFNAPALGAQIVASEYGVHPSTRNMSSEHKTIFTTVAPVTNKSAENKTIAQDGTTYTELVKSSQSSWGETDLVKLLDSKEPTASLDPNDIKGPVPIAISYEKKLSSPKDNDENKEQSENNMFDKTARVVVFGDSDWVTNGLITYFANRDLALNIINWLVGEEGGITIRPRSLKTSFAPISRNDFQLIFSCSLLIPELILLIGILVWWNRRTNDI